MVLFKEVLKGSTFYYNLKQPLKIPTAKKKKQLTSFKAVRCAYKVPLWNQFLMSGR